MNFNDFFFQGVQFDVRKLQLGDFLWVARERTIPTPGTALYSTLWDEYFLHSHWLLVIVCERNGAYMT